MGKMLMAGGRVVVCELIESAVDWNSREAVERIAHNDRGTSVYTALGPGRAAAPSTRGCDSNYWLLPPAVGTASDLPQMR